MTLQDKHIAIALRGVVDERTKKLAQALASAGADVCIHAFTFNRENYDGKVFRVVYHDSVEPRGSQLSSRVLRVAHNLSLKKLQGKVRTACLGAFGYKKIVDCLVADKPDLIIAVNADTLAASALAAQKLGIKFAYESYEFWPDHAREAACKLTNRQRTFLIQSELRYAPSAALMVTVSDYLAQEYASELKLATRPAVLYNAPDKIANTPSPAHSPLRVLFLGNIQRERNVEFLLHSVAKVQGVTLTFQGRGSMANSLRQEAHRLGIEDRVFFKDPVPYAQVADSASHYDVGVVCHEAYNRQMEGALPNKFFEYMAGGLAILAPRTHAFEMIEHFDTFGLFVDASSLESMITALGDLRDNPQDLLARKESAFALAPKYCGEVRQKNIVELYEFLLET